MLNLENTFLDGIYSLKVAKWPEMNLKTKKKLVGVHICHPTSRNSKWRILADPSKWPPNELFQTWSCYIPLEAELYAEQKTQKHYMLKMNTKRVIIVF